MVIQDGEGTFMSGGELVNGKARGEDPGDMRGDAIRGGASRVLKAGDVMFVPAGVPHGFVEKRPRDLRHGAVRHEKPGAITRRPFAASFPVLAKRSASAATPQPRKIMIRMPARNLPVCRLQP